MHALLFLHFTSRRSKRPNRKHLCASLNAARLMSTKVVRRSENVAIVVYKQNASAPQSYTAPLDANQTMFFLKRFWEHTNRFHRKRRWRSRPDSTAGGSGTARGGGGATRVLRGTMAAPRRPVSKERPGVSVTAALRAEGQHPAPSHLLLCSPSPFSVRAPPAPSPLTAVICGQAASPSIPPSHRLSLPPSARSDPAPLVRRPTGLLPRQPRPGLLLVPYVQFFFFFFSSPVMDANRPWTPSEAAPERGIKQISLFFFLAGKGDG